jgi:acetyltransferase-like isoleucine patch superfamily enzyme
LLFSRGVTWLHTRWLRRTYPFRGFGLGVSIHYSCDIRREMSKDILIENDVYLAPDVWLNVAPGSPKTTPKIILGNNCKIGRRSSISARNLIAIGDDVLFAPAVMIMDHNHAFSDVARPIHEQGVTEGGKIIIEKNCWLGYGVAILCSSGALTLGRNSVVGANSVVTRSFPPFSLIAGNPATVRKTYQPSTKQWTNP